MKDLSHVSRETTPEFDFTDHHFRQVSDIARQWIGLSLGANKKNMVYARLSGRLRRLGLKDFDSYLELLGTRKGESEMGSLISALTTNVTSFFREGHHFEFIRTTLLPMLHERARRGCRVRLWSAACSTGEEPYSLALLIAQAIPDAENYDIKILATDIDHDVLEFAKCGTYAHEGLQQIPERLHSGIRQDPFKSHFEIGDKARSLVSFRQLNLFEAWPFSGEFDIILCRNAAIYFDEPAQEKLWSSLAGRLAEDGHLFVGHSERVTGAALNVLEGQGVTHYKRKGNLQMDQPVGRRKVRTCR